MMAEIAWTNQSLRNALSAVDDGSGSRFSIRPAAGDDLVLVATMHEHGDLEIFINISAAQIAASVLLWPCDEQPDYHAFNEALLKAQKVVPLSNFGITTVGERDFYELFGELAPTSSLDTIVIELVTLADNAIEAASDLRTPVNSSET